MNHFAQGQASKNQLYRRKLRTNNGFSTDLSLYFHIHKANCMPNIFALVFSAHFKIDMILKGFWISNPTMTPS